MENRNSNIFYNKNDSYKFEQKNDILKENKDISAEDYFLNEEYEKYKKYLLLRNECPVCHFFQGIIFSGIGFFCFMRLFHFRSTYTRKDVIRMFSIGLPFSLFGIYKFTYVNYIIQMKDRMKELNKVYEIEH